MKSNAGDPAVRGTSGLRVPLRALEPGDRNTLFRRSGLDFDDYDSLVALAYGGTQDAVPWMQLLESLRTLLGANYVTLILRSHGASQSLQVVFAGEARPAIVQPYEAELAAVDPFVNLPRDRMVMLDELIDEAAWQAGVYYRSFHEPLNLRYHMGADIGMEAEPSCRLRVSRPPWAERFGERERAICNLLLPHLHAAVQLRASLDIAEVERHCYVGMLDRLSVGVVLLDRNARILRLNQAATEILGRRDGLSVVAGSLSAALNGEGRALRGLIERAVVAGARHEPGVVDGMSISRPSGGPQLGVAVRAMPPTEWSEPSSRPAAMVIIRDPDVRLLASDEQLKRLYGLTNAEASLALELMAGRTVDEAAQALGISRNTARCQVRAIFAKTGVTRQAELLRVLLSGVAPLA
ncbi:regulatory protein LuxR [Thauera sp. 28]|uniref:helix-turn-helix transcriptional regulator n=1 Tax=unclassified Thauera TaxID=2609274 RepID=UPI0002D0F9BC|nr:MULTISPECIES: helix-turn-helix transcriptional regulator [unclassified Thauera]ENO81149.1 regulatory protein LuxR [Thauera sp. 27]ENO94100.1 regulatory protein LuxR [Thauera sp. 28]HAG74716.1 LuxR family transcriptional regulator [Thauera sp.]